MQRVVLPTMELVYDRRHYLYMFDFYQDGILGIIRDTIHEYDNATSPKEELISKIVFAYDNSNQSLFHAIAENYNASSLVEITIRVLVEDIYEVIKTLYRNNVVYFNASNCQWVGEDIVVESTLS